MRSTCRNLAAFAMAASVLASPNVHAFGEAKPNKGDEWFMSLGGVSSHARDTYAAGRTWNERHSSLGLERRVAGLAWDASADKLWQMRYVAGTLEDSRSLWGSYAGVGVMREVAHHGPLRLHAGALTSIHYKSASWNGSMKLMPAVLPTLSLTDQRAGLGVNLVWVPPVRWAGRDTISTVLLQLNYRIEQ
jgi:hypothetical protein